MVGSLESKERMVKSSERKKSMIVTQKWMVGSLERKERMVKSLKRKIRYDRQTEMDGRIDGKERMLGSLERKDWLDRWKDRKTSRIFRKERSLKRKEK